MLNRHRAAAEAIRALGLARPHVLDAGCRDRALARLLPQARVVGVDLVGRPDVIADLGRLPFADRAFDVVCALDVLEHCDDLRAAFHEGLRVAAALLLVSLPNMAHPVFRARFALTGRLSGKYDLGDARQRDRHRWLTPLVQADALMRDLAREAGCRLTIARLTEGGRAGLLAGVLRPLGIAPQWWAWTSLYAVAR
jgi:SAM-dependent methyltransferase